PVSLIGIESQNVPREGHRPLDGPGAWGGGTLFPRSSKKVARAINAASANRPVVILANLSGFDGSPESLRQLQLEYGAEIARAVVRFEGLLIFLVVSRYHGGAYVVFSKALNPGLRALAFTGSYASVIGGSAAAAVVFTREVRLRAAADPAVRRARDELRGRASAALREAYERALADRARDARRAGRGRRGVRSRPHRRARLSDGIAGRNHRPGRDAAHPDPPAARGPSRVDPAALVQSRFTAPGRPLSHVSGHHKIRNTG